MNEDRRKAPVPQAKFARRKDDFHPVDFGERDTLPMDLCAEPAIATPEVTELFGTDGYRRFVEASGKGGAA